MKPRILIGGLLFILCSVVSAEAQFRYIVRTTNSSALQTLCRFVGCSIERNLGDPLSRLFLVNSPINIEINPFLLALTRQIGIEHLEVDQIVSIPIGGARDFLRRLTPPHGLSDRAPVNFYGDTVWNGYAAQPAAATIRVAEAQRAFRVEGRGIVAIIDTGVDPNHPALRNAIVPGYDFTRDEPGFASELLDVNQSTAAVVDGASPRVVNDNTIAVVNQSTAAVVDDPNFAAFGHGTMVAGVVHLVAPRASLMPLKAFRADGSGYLSNILRAVYWAAQHGAQIINMSFSTPGYSRELRQALDYSVSRRMISAASAGNDGRRTIVYPAGLDSVMGVASTDPNDRRSSFSNYGDGLVWVGAPGEAVISTYPFGTYSASWGTSFSTGFVSGAAALLLNLQPGAGHWRTAEAIGNAKPIGRDMGHGRLDVVRALSALQNLQ
jgi:hypothetical protein